MNAAKIRAAKGKGGKGMVKNRRSGPAHHADLSTNLRSRKGRLAHLGSTPAQLAGDGQRYRRQRSPVVWPDCQDVW